MELAVRIVLFTVIFNNDSYHYLTESLRGRLWEWLRWYSSVAVKEPGWHLSSLEIVELWV